MLHSKSLLHALCIVNILAIIIDVIGASDQKSIVKRNTLGLKLLTKLMDQFQDDRPLAGACSRQALWINGTRLVDWMNTERMGRKLDVVALIGPHGVDVGSCYGPRRITQSVTITDGKICYPVGANSVDVLVHFKGGTVGVASVSSVRQCGCM